MLVRVKYQDYESGDNFQRLNPATARPNLRFTEKQEPILLLGYHHEWSPGVHTLALGGRFINEQVFTDLATPQIMAVTAPAGGFNPFAVNYDLNYRSTFEVWSGEVSRFSSANSTRTSGACAFSGGSSKPPANWTTSPEFPASGAHS